MAGKLFHAAGDELVAVAADRLHNNDTSKLRTPQQTTTTTIILDFVNIIELDE